MLFRSLFHNKAGKLCGILTDGDIRRLLCSGRIGPDVRASDVMTTSAHFLAWAHSQEMVRLGACRSTDDLREILEAYAAEHHTPLGGWYQGHGWNHVLMDNVMPTRHDLDAVVPDIPVYLRRICGHV